MRLGPPTGRVAAAVRCVDPCGPLQIRNNPPACNKLLEQAEDLESMVMKEDQTASAGLGLMALVRASAVESCLSVVVSC